MADVLCAKCQQAYPDYEEEKTHESCPYVPCDDPACRALKQPGGLSEWMAAAIHWQSHKLFHGCSHSH